MSGPKQAQGQDDHSYALIWISVATFVALGVLWFYFKAYIVSAFLWLKYLEASLLAPIFSNLQSVKSTILSGLATPNQVSFNQMAQIGYAVGDYIRYPLVFILIVLAFFVYYGNLARSYKRTYSMEDLVEYEQDNWPQIMPVSKLDLVHTDIDKGPWAMAMNPMQFCKKYKLLDEYRPQRREGQTRKEWNTIEVVLKRGEANKLFALQLGSLWEGTHKLPLHIRALFAAFAARINADSESAAKLLKQLNLSSTTKFDFAGVDELCKKYENTKPVQKILQSHAYVMTMMASMLEGAREDGVQASSDFLWLKPLDRKMWYMLNTVGRQTPFVEVAGPYAHWLAEKEIGTRLLVPMIDSATRALEIALKEVVYHPDETEVE